MHVEVDGQFSLQANTNAIIFCQLQFLLYGKILISLLTSLFLCGTNCATAHSGDKKNNVVMNGELGF